MAVSRDSDNLYFIDSGVALHAILFMNPLTLVFISITGLFLAMLLVKKITGWNYCSICASVSITWLGLLVAYWFGYFEEPLIIGVLMGQSAVGLYYLVEQNVKKELLVFRLPFLLTEALLVFWVFYPPLQLLSAVFFVGLLWAMFFVVHVLRSKPQVSVLVKKLIECCKNW